MGNYIYSHQSHLWNSVIAWLYRLAGNEKQAEEDDQSEGKDKNEVEVGDKCEIMNS
jgi:tRNA(Glu) U13 pseudouridine synthase TruD